MNAPTRPRAPGELAGAYTATAIALHWLAALLIACNVALGLSMVDLPFGPQKFRWYGWHKWIGITVFLLAAARLVWRSAHSPPAPVAMPAWQRHAAAAVYGLLYVLMLAIPLSGWIYSSATGVSVVYLGLDPPAGPRRQGQGAGRHAEARPHRIELHPRTLVLVHVGAALKHHWVDRDGVLPRMLPFLRHP